MRSPLFGCTLLVVCSVLATQPVAAQRASELRSGLSASPPIATVAPDQSLRLSIRKTYWKEGAIIGGVAGWVAGYFIVDAFAPNASVPEKIIGGLGGVWIPGIIGALIGGQFPKREA